jgi:hypothetical protein
MQSDAAGVETDVLGIGCTSVTDSDRNAVVQAYPRTTYFKEDILQVFYDGVKHKAETTFGKVKADILADKVPTLIYTVLSANLEVDSIGSYTRMRSRPAFFARYNASSAQRIKSSELPPCAGKVAMPAETVMVPSVWPRL